MLKLNLVIIFVFFHGYALFSQLNLSGKLLDKDSTTVLPFVYVINKSNGNGTMSDVNGNFRITSSRNDTLVFNCVGYIKKYLAVADLLKESDYNQLKVYLKSSPINLNTVTVSTFKIKPYEREYMNSIIDKSRIRQLDYATSPISALYMQFSKEGKQLRKLAAIFEQVLLEEQASKKLNPEIFRQLTGDETIDYEAFRKYCYSCNDYYIVNHEVYDVYMKVMECYKNWKREGR
ncbi:MAG: carboxypeptidase-like regulatory domain-containing protein [Bacteroidetes bacterium]|nr:carboxypeptidase-like regulatory domain-containing protein [Bacteroidota bacterium]